MLSLEYPLSYWLTKQNAFLYSSACVQILLSPLQHWTRLKKLDKQPWPGERSGHAACCLNYSQEYPQLLVTGGLDRHDKPLADGWILDVERGSWRKVGVI